ncbi:MAG: hypothetical protein RXQ56_01280 [Thermoproteus sp.]|jgi:uncharacterized membrane protein|uniref:hypothetical protein n=1 Tax=Thermoproteus sp. CP80 TaxID=1650659 RepID=UPI00074A2019|nr:hypothetical protein [Thermoproteus sp. CP80]KUO83561.1 MAG: hypothetical protein AT711_07330 [Thermoproteus sp. CIS_19]KUO86908.1 MAG: hypothetical protein AT715_00715 [Thermoproteus sp. JCHS_4]MCI4447102.1 hypothetical protein [Pyrobaculum sp.]MCI4465741.1 hypothetical protein [Thermoproteus sp.]MDT7870868.1 hypothetical protein [Thermoproteus sp.]
MRKKGSLFVEETLLLFLAIGIFVAFALTVTGMIKGALGGILGFRNETNTLLSQLVNAAKQLVFGG